MERVAAIVLAAGRSSRMGAARAPVLERKQEAVRVLRRVEQFLGAPVDEVLPAGA